MRIWGGKPFSKRFKVFGTCNLGYWAYTVYQSHFRHYFLLNWAQEGLHNGFCLRSWDPDFRNFAENSTRELFARCWQVFFSKHPIFEPYFMRRFHFWNQFCHIFPSDGVKNCLRGANSKAGFFNLSQDCHELCFFWAQIRTLRKKLRLYELLWHEYRFSMKVRRRILFLVEILFLLFTNSRNSSGPNRPRIQIGNCRKSTPYLGIWFVFLIIEIHWPAPLPSLLF